MGGSLAADDCTIAKGIKWSIVQGDDFGVKFQGDDGSVTDGRPIYPYFASVRWDGCMDFLHVFNGYGWNHKCGDTCQCCEDSIHICDIDFMLEALEELRKAIKEYFAIQRGS